MANIDYDIVDISRDEVEAVWPTVQESILMSGKSESISEASVLRLAKDCIDYGVAMAAIVDGEAVAILAMSKVYETGSETRCTYKDEIFYVRKEFRASTIAKELIETAVAIGKLDDDVKQVSFGDTNAHGEAESRGWEYLMLASGLTEGGKTYILEV